MEARQGESILIVDDEDAVRRSIVRLLNRLGYQHVFEACSAGEAVEFLGRVRPGLVLTDICMETELAGFEVVRFATSRQIAVVVVSGQQPCLPDDLSSIKWFAKDEISLALLERELPSLFVDG